MSAILISKALGYVMARVNEELEFYLPPTRLTTNGISHPAFTPQPQNIIALRPALVSCPADDRRLSWPGPLK